MDSLLDLPKTVPMDLRYSIPAGFTQRVEVVTPELAAEYLELNTQNRTIIPPSVRQLARDIVSGKWQFTGETVVFDTTGKLIDGQHRLLAVVAAGVAVPLFIVRGIEKSAMRVINTGRPRTAAHMAQIEGHKCSNKVVAAARVLMALRDGKSETPVVAPHIMMEFVDRHPGLDRAISRCHAVRQLLPPALVHAWFYLASHTDPELADRALATIISGVPAYPDDPIHCFRERMIRMEPKDRTYRGVRLQLVWTMIAVWNDYVRGRTLTRCQIRPSPVKMIGFDLSSL